MKKLFMILAIIFGLSVASYSENNGGIFKMEENENVQTIYEKGGFPALPPHGGEGNQPAPLGAGTVLLVGFGAAYAMYKKNNERTEKLSGFESHTNQGNPFYGVYSVSGLARKFVALVASVRI